MGVEKNGNRGVVTSDNPEFQRFKVVGGLCSKWGTISFESLAKPGYYLRHEGFKIYLQEKIISDLYKKDACFYPRYNKYFQVNTKFPICF